MTGKDLLKKLNKLSPAQLKREVYLYLDNAEDGEFAIKLLMMQNIEDDTPYHKGDGPYVYDKDETKQFILISS